MPALDDDGYTLADSSAICHYLEAKHPDPALIPAEPAARGKTIWFDEFADTILFACGAAMFFNRVVAPRFLRREGDLAAADKAERETLPPLLDYLEGVIPASGYLVGDALTLADLAVASPFANLAHCGVTIDAARYPKVTRYVAGDPRAAELRRLDRARDRPFSRGRHEKGPRCPRIGAARFLWQVPTYSPSPWRSLGEVVILFDQLAAGVAARLRADELRAAFDVARLAGGGAAFDVAALLGGGVRLAGAAIVGLAFGAAAGPGRTGFAGPRLVCWPCCPSGCCWFWALLQVGFLAGGRALIFTIFHGARSPRLTPRSWRYNQASARAFRPRAARCDERRAMRRSDEATKKPPGRIPGG